MSEVDTEQFKKIVRAIRIAEVAEISVTLTPEDCAHLYSVFDNLNAEIGQMEAEIARLNAELLELNDKAVFIKFENEDELPAEIKDDVYSAIFECSHVDGVRLFPYIEEIGQKYFLVMLTEKIMFEESENE